MAIDRACSWVEGGRDHGRGSPSSDDKIIGEVRNIVFGTRDRRDYAIVAAGGFFTPGKDSIVVPIRFLKVSPERDSFFLPMPEAE